MNRAAIWLVGGFMGLATGVLVARPVAAFLGPTVVTWDATSCPTGIYTIIALARAQSTTQTYAVTTQNVSLPTATVVQQFPDLPPGTYRVSATAIGNNGKNFESVGQTVTVSGQVDTGGQGGGMLRRGRNRPASSPPTGFARPRNLPEPTPPPRPPDDPRLSPPSQSASRFATTAFRGRAREDSALEPLLERLLARLDVEAGSDGTDQVWRRIAAVDTDGDGAIDIVSVESVTGGIWVFRIVR